MIALLGKRPFEKEDPFDEAMLGQFNPNPPKMPTTKPLEGIDDSPRTEEGLNGIPIANSSTKSL